MELARLEIRLGLLVSVQVILRPRSLRVWPPGLLVGRPAIHARWPVETHGEYTLVGNTPTPIIRVYICTWETLVSYGDCCGRIILAPLRGVGVVPPRDGHRQASDGDANPVHGHDRIGECSGCLGPKPPGCAAPAGPRRSSVSCCCGDPGRPTASPDMGWWGAVRARLAVVLVGVGGAVRLVRLVPRRHGACRDAGLPR